MNAEQKQRALTALGMWHSSNDSSQREYQAAELMASLLQELVDAPTPEPFGYFKDEPFGWTDCAETDDGAIALYTAPPAPSVPPVRSTGQWESSRIADYNRGWNDCREATEKALNDLEKRK